jgi:hypothetical protein
MDSLVHSSHISRINYILEPLKMPYYDNLHRKQSQPIHKRIIAHYSHKLSRSFIRGHRDENIAIAAKKNVSVVNPMRTNSQVPSSMVKATVKR